MKRLKTLLFLFIFLILTNITRGQHHAASFDFERIVENVFAEQDQDLNYEELYESLYQLYQDPLDLNRTNPEELQATYLLSPLQINLFFQHQEKHGKLLSIYELQAIPEFDLTTIYRLLPFVTLKETSYYSDSKPFLKRLVQRENSMLLVRYERTLEEKKGYSAATLKSDSTLTSRYRGSEDKIYLRFRTSKSKDFSLGFTAEKDAGEQLRWNTSTKQYGLDYWSFHFSIYNRGRLKSLIVGDYQLQIGQGILLGAGFSPGKGAETIRTIRKGNLGIRPYTSVLESGYFRGIAATVNFGLLDLTSFYSNAGRDAAEKTSIDSLDTEKRYVSSIQASGLHRTANEIAARSSIREQVAGTNLHYVSDNKRLTVGITALYTHFDTPIKRTPRIYNRFEFSSQVNYNGGVYYSFNWQNVNIFGEAAISASKGTGIVNGIMINLSRHWEMSVLYRNYSRNFHALYGSAFSENSRNINEEGIYLGLRYSPSRKVSFATYFDQFRFPWLKYRVNAPSEGTEIMARVNFTPSKNLLLYGQYRREAKAINANYDNPLKVIEEGVKQRFLLNLSHVTKAGISFKSRIQFSNYQLGDDYSKGFAIAQDINFDLGKIRISTRAALFETDNYDNRQYVYERDVLYAFSIPAYFGKGIRNYLLIQYSALRNLDLWFRIARTKYRDKDVIGSGLEAIDGDTKTDLKLQVRYQF